ATPTAATPTAAPRAAAPAARLDADNPWPGLLSFTEDNRAFFHGRTQDVAALMRLIRRDTLTVLFGRSGYGKTSLLQAGLFPALRAEDFLPIKIRLDFAPDAPPLADQVARRLRATFAEEGIDAPPPDTASLWAYFHDARTEFWSRRHHLLTPVLVFDQFEEILTLGATARRDEADALLTQIADLAESRPPAEVRAAIERGERDAAEWRLSDSPVKLVLSFREDYLAQFEALRGRMPSIMTGRMRVLPMTVQQGLEAVLASGGHLVDASVAREIVAFVAGRGADHVAADGATQPGEAEIEPALLSVVCHELNRRRRAVGLARISHALLDVAHDAIIADFYRQSVAATPDALRRLIEDELVTLDGHRKSFPLADALGRPGVREADIAALVGHRILRVDDRFGSRHLELTHDLLTGVVRAARAE
ncbi:nSTAND1 domain-containing NTPase, partial [Acidisphaera rubrifaciens]|uniref:nSTAND1 domain-containing NTPase n=1 Tax=Acidisphaera rubrifaciens TaxID=50715 RepID=UPI0006621C7F